MSECGYCTEAGWEGGWFSLALQQEVGGWLFPCPIQILRGGFSPALAMMGEDGGTELWTCLGLSVKWSSV